MYNKQGSAYILIYGLVFFLFLGTLYIIFNQIQKNEIRDILNSPSMNFTAEDKAEAARFEGLWNMLPFIFVFLLIMFLIVHIGMTGG